MANNFYFTPCSLFCFDLQQLKIASKCTIIAFKKPIVILFYYFEIYLYFICTGETFCLHVCMFVHTYVQSCGQKRTLDPLEL